MTINKITTLKDYIISRTPPPIRQKVGKPRTNTQPTPISYQLLHLSAKKMKQEGISVRVATSAKEKALIHIKVWKGLSETANGSYLNKLGSLYIKIKEAFKAPFIGLFRKDADMVGIYNKGGKIIGGLIAAPNFSSYHIEGLYLDPKHQRKKETFAILNDLSKHIKTFAEDRGLKSILCEVLKSNPTTEKLYKRIGLKDANVKTLYHDDKDKFFNTLYASTKEFGIKFSNKPTKKNLL